MGGKGGERHTLDPDLVPGVLGEDGQRRDVQPELARLAELAEAGAEGQEVVARDVAGEVGDREAHVVDAVAHEAEDVAVGVGAVVKRGDEVLERGARVVGQLGEERLRLLLG
jgi:hypothetical protein